MKKILSFILFSVMSVICQAQSVAPEPCSDLFLSELTFGKVPHGGIFDLNYAIEIFNPTQDTLNLENYTLELSNSIGVVNVIQLHGPILPGDVYVVCNDSADSNLRNLADTLTYQLDFEANVFLELKKGTKVLDRIGQIGTPTNNSIDLVQLFSDPYNYLLSFHVDLNDYQNIDIRRSSFIDHGDPNFTVDSNFVLNWHYSFNFDRSNIGTYLNVCNKPLSTILVDYALPGDNLLYPLDGSPLVVTFTPSSVGSISLTHSLSSTDGNFNYNNTPCNAYFVHNTTGNSYTCTQSMSSTSNCENVNFLDNNFIGIKFVIIKLTSSDANFASNYDEMYIVLHGTPTQVPDLIYDNDIKIWPTVTNSEINIESNGSYQCLIYDINGAKVFSEKIDYKRVIDISNFSNGLYFIKLLGMDMKQHSFKIIKN